MSWTWAPSSAAYLLHDELAVARLQARAGATVTNLRHERVDLDEVGLVLLRHLDGSRDRVALLAVLEGLAADLPEQDLSETPAQRLDRRLDELLRQSLLIAETA